MCPCAAPTHRAMSIVPILDPNRVVLGRAHDLLMRGLDAQQSACRHLPRRRQCHLLEIWGETGPRARSPPGSEAESDTALLCCTPLGHRPLRRFKEEEGCCCFLLRGERCCWGDREGALTCRSKTNDERCALTPSFFAERTVERLDGFFLLLLFFLS